MKPTIHDNGQPDALYAQVDALKRLQAETAGRRGLHPLAAILPAILDRAFKGEL